MGIGEIHQLVVVWRVLLLLLPTLVRGLQQQTLNPASLDSLVHELALRNASSRRTGRLYDVVLPANYSGIEASVARFRTGSLWRRGANVSYFRFPPGILPDPFSKRIDFVFQNLGNWSSSYYTVPGYNFVVPVVGFFVYEAESSYRAVELKMENGSILISFPNATSSYDVDAVKCVRFEINGAVEFTNVMSDGSCVVWGQGYFSIVIPEEENKGKEKKKKGSVGKWWGVGFGIVGLLVLVGILGWRMVKNKRVKGMERQSEKSERLGAVWVGRSRMPYASSIRTQPVLEDNYVP